MITVSLSSLSPTLILTVSSTNPSTWHWHSITTRDEDKGGWGVLQQLLAPEVAKAFHGPCNKALQNLAITHPEVEDLGHFEVQLHSC